MASISNHPLSDLRHLENTGTSATRTAIAKLTLGTDETWHYWWHLAMTEAYQHNYRGALRQTEPEKLIRRWPSHQCRSAR
jgi:hypothetical protein